MRIENFIRFDASSPRILGLVRNQNILVPRIQLCKTDEVPIGGALKIETAGLILALFRTGSEFYTTDDCCTHGPGSLSEGFLEGEVIECNFHQGKFNIRTGEVVLPPCTVPIRIYKTVVEDGTVYIEV